MSDKYYYITTPIYYPSDKLHIGHTYTTVACDSMSRYKKARGYNVKFLTGTDEHGQKIEKVANQRGMTPKAHLDEIIDWTKDLWRLMGVDYDIFIRTTDDYHMKTVQKIFKKLYDQGDIYKSDYEGLYCTPCESFFTETQLVDGKCPDCNRAVEPLKEEAYFFKLSAYTDKLIKYIEENPEFIQPITRQKEMLNNFLKPGLTDLCVSRTSFKWGIPVDFDTDHVVYVWIDALSNYVSALGYLQDNDEDFKNYWPADVHVVGKEIVRFHTIIWPAILMALDLPLPKQVFGHGWLTIGGGKMSKSVGNVVDPMMLVERYGLDAIRYFLMREVAFGQDGDFSNEALVKRMNADLANDLGNLLSRTVGMIDKYFDGTVPETNAQTPHDKDQIDLINKTIVEVEQYFDEMKFNQGLNSIWHLISNTNKYADKTEPWVLVKDETRRDELARVMYVLSESLRIISVLISPVLVNTPKEIRNQLNINENICTWDSIHNFGALPKQITITKGAIVFPRLDLDKELEELAKIKEESAKNSLANQVEAKDEDNDEDDNIAFLDFDDFLKVKLQIGEIVEAEPVKKSKKLIKCQVKFGDTTKQVLSGVAPKYTAEQLQGKKALYVTNLAPRKIMGEISEGMLVCAEGSDGTISICTLESDRADNIEGGAIVG